MLAIDEKLRAGMAQFEVPLDPRSESWGRPFLSYWLGPHQPLKQEIAESKLLLERIRLVRDLVANKVLVLTVIEAAQAKEWDTPAGIERVRGAMVNAPPGRQYGAGNVHVAVMSQLQRAKSDTAAIGELSVPVRVGEATD